MSKERVCVHTRGWQDLPLPLCEGATISAPHIHALALDRLWSRLKPGARVLDVGSGPPAQDFCGDIWCIRTFLAFILSSLAGLFHDKCPAALKAISRFWFSVGMLCSSSPTGWKSHWNRNSGGTSSNFPQQCEKSLPRATRRRYFRNRSWKRHNGPSRYYIASKWNSRREKS